MDKFIKRRRWKRLNKLCWEGFDKVRKYASENYPDPSVNKSLDFFMTKYEGDWDKKIDDITT